MNEDACVTFIFQSLGLALVHAHTRLTAEHSGQNRTVDGPAAKNPDSPSAILPLKVTR